MKIRDVKIFFRSAYITATVVCCAVILYLGVCKSYEAMRQTCFSDSRNAVILGEGYIKFFDFEVYF